MTPSIQEATERIAARIDSMLPEIREVQQLAEGRRLPAEGSATLQRCLTATLGLGQSLYGRGSLQLEDLERRVDDLRKVNPYQGVMDGQIATALIGFLENLRAEVEGGLVTDVMDQGFSSALGDFLLLAEQAQKRGNKDVAAVLAAASLEDALKRKAKTLGIDTEGLDLSDVINTLKAESFFRSGEANIVSSFVRTRNKAMHAEWDDITPGAVDSIIGYMKGFVATRF